MSKITMTTPLVEMDGDEMTRILWKMIKDALQIMMIVTKHTCQFFACACLIYHFMETVIQFQYLIPVFFGIVKIG